MSTEQENREIAVRLIETTNSGDMKAHLALYAPQVNNHGFVAPRDVIAHILGDIRRTFPDMRFDLTQIIAEGEWITVRATFSGTHLGVGELPVNGGMLVGVRPTKKSFSVNHIHLWRIQNGLVTEHHACRDDISMMRQLGLLPPEPPFPAPALTLVPEMC